MKRYLLDSNAISNFTYRRKGMYDRVKTVRQTGAIIGTAIPVVAEILAGSHYSETWQQNVPRIEAVLKKLRIWPFELEAAREYASLFAELRRLGINMQAMDLMIAATAFTLPNCTVVTCDSDFSRVPGLKIENWES